ncbi:MAG TPA: hypothetical protein VMT86_15690 [Bryobacteraceae bacterium]|nr:hypothetical protein [Bryobacteraceae bacterium]
MMVPRIPSARAKSGESGYAMLLVFLMAALIAIALYNELPRVAFEKQRDKEQLLVERGEQYKRAIQIFVRKMGRYPATIDELESTNNIRFLRRRYVDPMTGKDTWRLIHINGGVLTDSIIQKNKPGQDQQQQANTNTFIGEGPAMGGSTDPSQQQNNPALRRRASDDRPVATAELPQPQPAPEGDQNGGDDADNSNGLVTDNNAPPQGTQGMVNQPPGMLPNQPGMMPGGMPVRPGMIVPGMANQPLGTTYSTGALPNQQAGYGYTTGGMQQTAYPGQSQNSTDGSSSSGVYAAPGLGQSSTPTGNTTMTPGMPGQPGMAYPNQQGFGNAPTPFGQPASNGAVTGGFGGGNSGFQQSTQNLQGGISMNDLGLTSARPGGLQGMQGMSGAQMGGGIAGVASESKSPSIMVYNERKKYNEWEFVYDQTKDRGLAGVQAGGGAPGTSAAQMGNMPPGMNAQQPGMSSFGQNGNSAFGNNGAFGNSSPFGASGGVGGNSSFGGGFGQQPQPPQPQQQPPN